MADLKNTTAMVKNLLEQNEKCRNSDSFLYLKVLSLTAKQKGVDLYKMSVPIFLLTMQDNGFPPFESVRRARQKVQAQHPELAASNKVKKGRAENEAEYREYARG
jgi:hypothetical protein